MELNGVLAAAVERGASDLHLKAGSPAMARVDGVLAPIDDRRLSDADLEVVFAYMTEHNPKRREHFEATGDLDTVWVAHGIGRFRVNVFRQRGSISFAFRFVPKDPLTLEELGLPPGVRRLAAEERGLILVTGASGAGKSTTLAAMIDEINRTRRQHVITIEDPVEVLHEDKGCIVNQREVELDTESFTQALRRVLRQDPDVILIGELRDEESARVALQAAESGHLVLSTMHTFDATETIGRMVEFFPAAKQVMVRQILAGVLRGVVSQRLLPRIGGGRLAAVEVMINTARIADLILDPAKTAQIGEAIEQGGVHQMQTFSQHLVQLVLDELVDFETAANAASNRHDFGLAVQRALSELCFDPAQP